MDYEKNGERVCTIYCNSNNQTSDIHREQTTRREKLSAHYERKTFAI
jgi:hypothetical protein